MSCGRIFAQGLSKGPMQDQACIGTSRGGRWEPQLVVPEFKWTHDSRIIAPTNLSLRNR